MLTGYWLVISAGFIACAVVPAVMVEKRLGDVGQENGGGREPPVSDGEIWGWGMNEEGDRLRQRQR